MGITSPGIVGDLNKSPGDKTYNRRPSKLYTRWTDHDLPDELDRTNQHVWALNESPGDTIYNRRPSKLCTRWTHHDMADEFYRKNQWVGPATLR